METCECIQHSDGGCPLSAPDILETAGNGTETAVDAAATDSPSSWGQTEGESGTDVGGGAISDGGGLEVTSGTVRPLASSDATKVEEGLVTAELGADGRLLQENRQAITTDLEIKFVTDVEVRTER